jgi:hypothetical protein
MRRRRTPVRTSARVGSLATWVVLAALMTAAVTLVSAAPASANTHYIGCGNPTGVGGIVGAMDLANRHGGGTVTVQLTAGCTYTIPEPAWDYDQWGNKHYYTSAFWPINNTLGYDNKMIVEGNGATITIAGSAGRIRLFDIGSQGDVELRNLTITGVNSPHGQPDAFQNGGNAASNGGAIANSGTLVLDRVTFTNNSTGSGENGDYGGSTEGNPGGAGGNGGAVSNNGTLIVRNSTFTSNTTGGGGAGSSAVMQGGAGGVGGAGGAIWNAGNATIVNSTFNANTTGPAGSAGGGVFGGPPGFRGPGGAIAGSGPVSVTGSLFLNNNAEGTTWAEGGAINLTGTNGDLTVSNSTFIGNRAWRGGALHLSQGDATIRNSTFQGNDATGTGDYISGDVAALDRGSTTSFANTLMVGNDGGQVDCNTHVWEPAVSYTSLGGLISDENSGCGTNTVLADPKLESLGSWGGPTQSRLPRADSAVLGAGVTAYCGGTDQRGVPRPSTGCDVGAVERIAGPTGGAISGPTLVPLNSARTYSTTAVAGGAPLTYAWSVSGVAAAISSTTAAAPSITFTGSGTATLTLTVRVTGSSDGEALTQTLTVKVPPADNVAPTVTWVGTPASAANEGETKRFTYAVSDSNGDTWSLTSGYPTCGTGGTLVTHQTYTGGGYFDCRFPNGPATSTVAVQAADVWTSTGTASASVTIAEVAPTITVTGSGSATEGSTATYSFTIVESGSDTFTPVTTCTGTGSSKVGGSDVYNAGTGTTTGSFQCRWGNGPTSGAATVTANGGSGSRSVSVTNVAPSIAISGPTPVTENGALTNAYRYELNATDPGDQGNLTLVSGSASCGASGTVVSADATAILCRFPAGPTTSVVSATVQDPDGAQSSGGSRTVSVTNVAPTVTISQPGGAVPEGSTAYYLLTATDPGADTLTVTAPSGCTANFTDTSVVGRLTSTIACTYADGPATVSKTVTVSDGAASGTATISNQQVTDVAPTLGGAFARWDTWEGESIGFTMGSVTDPGVDTPTSVKINWGDGASNTYSWPLATSNYSHVYTQDGEYFATIEVIDGDGTHENVSGQIRIVVHATAPSLAIYAPPHITEAAPARFDFVVDNNGEPFTVTYSKCGYDHNGQLLDPVQVDINPDFSGGSIYCHWTVAQSGKWVRLDILSEDGPAIETLYNINVENEPTVVEWTSGPDVVFESDTAVYRYDFHASDGGSLGMIVLTYSMYGGLGLMYGCGNGELVSQVPYYYGGTVPGVVFDPQTGDGYIECKFREGPGTGQPYVTISDWQSQTTISRNVTVVNAAPTVAVTAPVEPILEGVPAPFTFAVSDVNDPTTVQDIDCGPGGTVGDVTGGSFTCTYDDGPGDPTASVTVSDGELEHSSSVLVHVEDAPPTAIALSGSGAFEVGEDYELTLGEVTDAGEDTPIEWVIEWGDGAVSRIAADESTARHIYQELGEFTISVGVVDEDGEHLAISTSAVRDADHTPPEILSYWSLPITMEAGEFGYVYSWIPFYATDDRDGAIGLWCNGWWLHSYQSFGLGDSTFDCEATDAAGNTTYRTLVMTVVDTTPPQFAAPGFTEVTATSEAGANVTWNAQAFDIVDREVPGTCDATPGTLFSMGEHTVHCEATDNAGNTGVLDFTFTVGDFEGPALTSVDDIVVSATGPDGAIVTFDVPTATDALDGELPVTCDPISGSTFPVGATEVTCIATDEAGNDGTETFTVTVNDTGAPELAQPQDILAAPTGPDGAVVTFDLPAVTDDVDSDLEAECSPASGSLFAIGVTTVTCSVEDEAGNPADVTFLVTVQDEQAPVVTAPSSMVVAADSIDGATVTYSGASAVDLVDGALPVECSPTSGGVFPIAITTVTCTATDGEGNVGTATFTVTVEDAVAPVVDDAPDISREATGALTSVTFANPAAQDVIYGALESTCLPASGSGFAVGDTIVTCTATDGSDNSGTSEFTVTITDTTAPVLSGEDITFPARSAAGTIVTLGVTATDLVDGSVPVSCDPADGSLFAPESVTEVECVATDDEGNVAALTITVTVSGTVTTASVAGGATELEIAAEIFEPGDYVMVDPGGPNQEVRLVDQLGSIIFAAPLAGPHAAGTTVVLADPPPLGDTTGPNIAPSSFGPVKRGSSAAAPISCTDLGVGVEACIVPPPVTSTVGTYTLSVVAWDYNGNVTRADVTYEVVAASGSLGNTGPENAGTLSGWAAAAILAGIGLLGIVVVRRRREEAP